MAMTLRLAEEQDKQLTEVAGALGLSKQQVVEKAVEQFLARESQEAIVGRVFEMVRVRDKELLERLADA
jgi:predicted transcriptional regulator